MDDKNHQVIQRTSSWTISDLKLKNEKAFPICPKIESIPSVYLPRNDLLTSGRSLTLCREGKQTRWPQAHSCLTLYDSMNRKTSSAKFHSGIWCSLWTGCWDCTIYCVLAQSWWFMEGMSPQGLWWVGKFCDRYWELAMFDYWVKKHLQLRKEYLLMFNSVTSYE